MRARCTRRAALGAHLRVAFCLRGYKKLAGLYDVSLKVAVLGAHDRGAESAIAVSGIDFDNAERLVRRYLEAVSWTP